MSTEAMSIDDAIETGDPVEIAKALAEIETDVDTELEGGEGSEVVTDLPTDDESIAPSGESEAEKVLLSKSGKEEIPFSVLEGERSKNQALREELDRVEREKQDLIAKQLDSEASLNNVKARLEAKGMDTEVMLSDPDSLSEDEWKEMEDDYGNLAVMFRKMHDKMDASAKPVPTSTPAQQENPSQNPDVIPDIIKNDPDLSVWQKSDPDRWAAAIAVDDKLKLEPAWQGKSLEERFEKVVELTKQQFDQAPDAKARAKKIIDETQQPAPDSLTDFGQSPARDKSSAEALAAMTTDQIEEQLSGMSSTQVSELLSGGF